MAVVDVGGWVAPAMELIYEQGTPEVRGQWGKLEPALALAPPRTGRGDWRHPALQLSGYGSRRTSPDAWTAEPNGHGATNAVVPDGILHDNAAGRARALEEAGVTLQLLSPGPSIDACLALDSALAAGLFAAYNRYIVEYCRAAPGRLGAVLQLHGSEPSFSAQEVAELAPLPPVRAVSLCLPVRIAPDDRQFEPLWQALDRFDLPLLHRPSLCAAVWTPGRLLAYLREAGVLARYPRLRIAFRSGGGELAAVPRELRSRVFLANETAAGERESLWASDYPLRGGGLAAALNQLRATLGDRADQVLSGSPNRFLNGRTT